MDRKVKGMGRCRKRLAKEASPFDHVCLAFGEVMLAKHGIEFRGRRPPISKQTFTILLVPVWMPLLSVRTFVSRKK